MPLTNFVPKALFPIANQPALRLLLNRLASLGIREFFINAHHLAPKIVEAVRDGSIVPGGAEINVVVEQEEILGTAGGIGNLYRSAGTPNETILLHNCDVIENFDLAEAYEIHRSSGAAMSMLLTDNPDTNSVIVEGDFVVGFERGRGLTYSGVALMEPEMMRSLPQSEPASLKDYIVKWSSRRLVRGIALSGFWRDFGTFTAYLHLHRSILIDGALEIDGAGRRFLIGDGANVHPAAELSGFVALGSGASVPQNCKLANCVVWENTDVPQGMHINRILTPFGIVDVN